MTSTTEIINSISLPTVHFSGAVQRGKPHFSPATTNQTQVEAILPLNKAKSKRFIRFKEAALKGFNAKRIIKVIPPAINTLEGLNINGCGRFIKFQSLRFIMWLSSTDLGLFSLQSSQLILKKCIQTTT